MINRIIKILVFGIIMTVLLSFGGYTFESFKHEIHLKDPVGVFEPITSQLPDMPSGDGITVQDPDNPGSTITVGDNNPSTGDNNNDNELPDFFTDPGLNDPGLPNFGGGDNSSNTPSNEIEKPDLDLVDEDGNIKKQDIKVPSNISISYIRSIKVNIDGKEVELTSSNTINFIKWLTTNYTDDAEISYVVDKDEPENEENIEVVYNNILESEDDLNKLVKSINVIDKLPDYNDYDRSTYEKPVISYKLDGNKVNRNDYAWKTSPYFDPKTYTYMCPYTGTIINDLDDKKEDKDFGNLDYDHIVPLKSTYLRGAKDWTPEQMNEYAYDQWVGVDVLNSANRSKSDKGPTEYLPDINVEDYCYSWLMICSKYNLSMTQEEIDICVDNISIALENGESVEFLGGTYEE